MRHDDPPTAEPPRPVPVVALVLVAVAVLAAAAVALGAPVAFVVVPPICAAALAVTTVQARQQAAAAERAVHEHELRAAELERQMAEEAEARRNAESRLAWRSRLGSLRRQRQGDTLIDPESGLLLEGLLFTNVESRIAAGRRRLTPVAVVMLEVLEYAGVDDPRPVDAGQTAELLHATLREADGAFRLDEGGFCVVLEDTDDTGAMLVTKRFGEAIEAMAPGSVVRAGVACYPAHGMTAREVLDRADEALDEARRWRQHRIEVARADRTP